MESRGVGGPGGPDSVRRDADVLDRESEKKRRVDDVRLGAKLVAGGESGGEPGPRRLFKRCIAASHNVHGCVWLSPTCPHPL